MICATPAQDEYPEGTTGKFAAAGPDTRPEHALRVSDEHGQEVHAGHRAIGDRERHE